MPKLVSRERYIPNGFRFYQPEIKWQAPPNASFNVIVNTLIRARQANPPLIQKYGWSTDYNTVANEVDTFNASLCASMGWTEFFVPDGGQASPPPFSNSPLPSQSELSAVGEKVKTIWSGVKTLNEWLDSGTAPVAQDVAEKRAAICAGCPKNVPGDFTAWFTIPAAAAIKKQLERVSERKLATAVSDRLNVCEICYCPMKLKVFTPVEFIRRHTRAETMAQLRAVPGCWVPAECG